MKNRDPITIDSFFENLIYLGSKDIVINKNIRRAPLRLLIKKDTSIFEVNIRVKGFDLAADPYQRPPLLAIYEAYIQKRLERIKDEELEIEDIAEKIVEFLKEIVDKVYDTFMREISTKDLSNLCLDKITKISVTGKDKFPEKEEMSVRFLPITTNTPDNDTFISIFRTDLNFNIVSPAAITKSFCTSIEGKWMVLSKTTMTLEALRPFIGDAYRYITGEDL